MEHNDLIPALLLMYLGLIISAVSLILIPISLALKFNKFTIKFLFNAHGAICIGHAYIFLKFLKDIFYRKNEIDPYVYHLLLWSAVGTIYFILFGYSAYMRGRGRIISIYYYYSIFIIFGIAPLLVIASALPGPFSIFHLIL